MLGRGRPHPPAFSAPTTAPAATVVGSVEARVGGSARCLPVKGRHVSKITAYHQDEAGHWVAELSCGHGQHVRHTPPWQVRPWVATEAGRQAHVGHELACPLCAMPVLPSGLETYKQTDELDGDTVPKGLLRSHRLKPSVWGQIVVTEGVVVYVIETEPPQAFPLNPRVVGVVAPEQPHHVIVQPGARFFVRFLRPTA